MCDKTGPARQVVIGGICLWLFAAAGFSADTSTVAAANNAFTEYKLKYDASRAAIQRCYETDISQVPTNYLKGLDALELDLQKKGDLMGVIDVRKEKGKFAAYPSVPGVDEPDLPAITAGLRQKLRQQVWQFGVKRDKATIDLMQIYIKYLGSLAKQRTQENRIEEALEIHAEIERVKDIEAALATAINRANEPAVPDKSAPQPEGESVAAPVSTAGDSNTVNPLLDKTIIPIFSFEASESNNQQVETINKFIDAVFSKGIKLRIAAGKLDIESIASEHGVPQYRVRYRPSSRDDSKRMRNYTLTDSPARCVLQAICAGFGLGYKIDAANGEVVLLDNTAADVEWAVCNAPPEQLLRELQSIENKKKLAGKPVMVTGEVTGTMQGMADATINLNNKVRLLFPKSSTNSTQTADIQAKYSDANRANRDNSYENHFVEITAIGEINRYAGSSLLILDKCRIIECYTGMRNLPRDAPRERKIIRIGE